MQKNVCDIDDRNGYVNMKAKEAREESENAFKSGGVNIILINYYLVYLRS